MKVLGIDPGYERLGVAIVEKDIGHGAKEVLLYSDCIKTSSKLPFPARLAVLGDAVQQLIAKHKPDALAIEKLYFTNNQKTAMNVAQAIGAIIYIAKSGGVEVYEYTPLQIKVACAGNGRADKQQIMTMLPHLIKIDKEIKYDDEYDAIAVALTHVAHKPRNLGEKSRP